MTPINRERERERERFRLESLTTHRANRKQSIISIVFKENLRSR